MAIRANDLTAVRAALRGGANTNAVNNDSYTPSNLAALRGEVEVVQALLAAGANCAGARLPVEIWGNLQYTVIAINQGADLPAEVGFTHRKMLLEVAKRGAYDDGDWYEA